MGFVALEAQAQIPKLVKEFSPQKDKAQVAKCELAKAAIKFAIDACMEMLSQASTGLAAPFLGRVSKGTKTAFPLLKQWLNYVGEKDHPIAPGLREKQLAAHIKNAASGIKYTVGQGTIAKNMAKGANNKGKDSQDKTTSSGTGDMPALEMHLTKARGMCGNLFHVAEDNNPGTIDSASKFIIDYLGATQDALEDHFNSLVGYNDDGEYPKLLDPLMDAEYGQVRNMGIHKDTKT